MAGSRVMGRGTRIQAGVPLTSRIPGRQSMNGLHMRGVVTATYVTDSDGHPRSGQDSSPPIAVYCDVVVYTSLPGDRWFPLSKVLVSQPWGGMHSGKVWKPKATSKNILGQLDRSAGANIGAFDGDHVVITYLNNNPMEPIIVGALPHPSLDIGNESMESGKRMKLKLADGSPDFIKHNGVFHGTTQDGDYEINTTHAHGGALEEDGKEPAPKQDGANGNLRMKLPKGSVHSVVFYDMVDPENPAEITRMVIEDDGDNAKMTLGDGAASVAIADHIQTLYETAVTGIADAFKNHKHPSGTGPTGTPDLEFPDWDDAINSQKLTIPNNS